MEADGRKEEPLLPPDYVSLAQLQKQWMQKQEEKKLNQKQEEEKKNNDPRPPIGDPHQFHFAIDSQGETADGRRVAKDKEEVEASGEGEIQGMAASEKKKNNRKRSSKKNRQSQSTVQGNDGNAITGEKGASRTLSEKKGTEVSNSLNVIDASLMNTASGRAAGVNRRGRGTGGNFFNRDHNVGSGHGIRQEYRLKQEELNKTGGNPSSEVDTKSDKDKEGEVLAVCNAIYSLNTGDEKGISEPKWNVMKDTEANTADEKCLIAENVVFEDEDETDESKGESHHENRSFGKGKSTFTAENEYKRTENYNERVRVGNGFRRYWGPTPRGGYNRTPFNYRNEGNMRSSVEMNVGFGRGRFESGWNRREGNRHSVWMKKGENLNTDAAEEGSSGVLADEN